MFRGSFEHTIDEKGRVSIPAKFREIVLGMQDDRLVVTKFILNSHRCLDVYPQAEWERFEQELTKKPRFDEDFLKNFVVNDVKDIEKLTAWKPISTYWPSQPFNDRLHVIVQVPPAGE